jgi:hypothetical protein
MTRFAVLFALLGALHAADLDRDFSGSWILLEDRSRPAGPNEPDPFLKIIQDSTAIHCATADVSWTYLLDGKDSKYKFGNEERNSAVKWEGAALLINTLVAAGSRNYTLMDRWELSPDRNVLTISREAIGASGPREGVLVYRRAGTRQESAAPPGVPSTPQPVLTPRTPRTEPVAGEAMVPSGTHVLLELINELNVKRSRDGDKVYLRTSVPIAAGGRVVIPRGSNVFGTVVEVKNAKGKREDLYIRFDSLTLPSGATRDLHARPEDKEGKISTPNDHGRETREVARDAGLGASIGGLAGIAVGHVGAGLGIGGLAGAAAGLGSVLSKRQDVTLRPGTHVDMVLNRDLSF